MSPEVERAIEGMSLTTVRWESPKHGPITFKAMRIVGVVEVYDLPPLGIVKLYYDLKYDRWWAKRWEPCEC